MKTYIIDHESYGARSEFASLPEAQETIRGCGGDFAATELTERGGDILDETGAVIGSVIDGATIGRRLTAWKDQSKLSLFDMAHQLGIKSITTLASWIRGRTVPTGNNLAAVERELTAWEKQAQATEK